MKNTTLTIVGVGLLGGSIALAAKERGLAGKVIGVGRGPERLAMAREAGLIDEIATDLVPSAARSDAMVFCTPVDEIARQVCAAAGACSPRCLLTDVGSTKQTIVELVEKSCGPKVPFVGSHPLAGSEKQGWRNASANLFVGRTAVITLTARSLPAAIEGARGLWRDLGAQVVEMEPAEHDRVLAKTSHLPHVIAATLASCLRLKREELKLAATGLRDTTRIAAGDPELWTAIILENRREISAALVSFQEALTGWLPALQSGDRQAIRSLLEQGKQSRDALGN